MRPLPLVRGDGPLELKSSINQQSLAYWRGKLAGRRMPDRADIDPAEMTAFLPYVFLIGVQAEPLDFQYRLIGTVMDQHMTGRYTGRWMSQIPHQREPSVIWKACRQVVATGLPMTSEVPYVGRHKEFKRTEDVIMPLTAGGEAVGMLLVTAAFLSGSDS